MRVGAVQTSREETETSLEGVVAKGGVCSVTYRVLAHSGQAGAGDKPFGFRIGDSVSWTMLPLLALYSTNIILWPLESTRQSSASQHSHLSTSSWPTRAQGTDRSPKWKASTSTTKSPSVTALPLGGRPSTMAQRSPKFLDIRRMSSATSPKSLTWA